MEPRLHCGAAQLHRQPRLSLQVACIVDHRSVTTWISRVREGRSPVGDSEQLSPEERAREALVLGLRRTAGIDRAAFQTATGFDVASLTAGRIARYVADGLVDQTETALRLTRAGRFVADSVIVDLL